MPRSDWILKKLKLTLAKEKPLGRTVRPGLGTEQVNEICKFLKECVAASEGQKQKDYANLGAAIALIYEKGLRTVEACPGQKFDPALHISRHTIKGPMDQTTSMPGLKAFVIPPPKRKTSYSTSDVARHKASLPMVIRTNSKMHYSFASWAKLLKEVDPNEKADTTAIPAFRMGTQGIPMSTRHLSAGMAAAAKVVVKDWNRFSYSAYSLRIGRNNAWRLSGLMEHLDKLTDIVCASTSHTSSAGRSPYDRPAVQEIIALDTAADEVVVQPLETLTHYGVVQDGNDTAAYVTEDDTGKMVLAAYNQDLVDSDLATR